MYVSERIHLHARPKIFRSIIIISSSAHTQMMKIECLTTSNDRKEGASPYGCGILEYLLSSSSGYLQFQQNAVNAFASSLSHKKKYK